MILTIATVVHLHLHSYTSTDHTFSCMFTYTYHFISAMYIYMYMYMYMMRPTYDISLCVIHVIHVIRVIHISLQTLTASLMSVVDFPKVALSVAQYGRDSLRGWTKTTANWTEAIHAKGLRWSGPWDLYPNQSLAAVEAFLAAPVKLNPCRKDWSFGTEKEKGEGKGK